MTATATHTMTTIECACDTCHTNAAKVGASFPLRAEVTKAFAAVLTTRKAVHNAVYDAHHPVLKGRNPLVRAL